MEHITVNDFFDQVYLINLKRRPDKLKTCQQLLAKLNIKYQIFEGVDFCDGIPEDYPVKPLEGSFLWNHAAPRQRQQRRDDDNGNDATTAARRRGGD